MKHAISMKRCAHLDFRDDLNKFCNPSVLEHRLAIFSGARCTAKVMTLLRPDVQLLQSFTLKLIGSTVRSNLSLFCHRLALL